MIPVEHSHPLVTGTGAGAGLRAVGMMSGTSLDGIDVAVVDTDGRSIARLGPHCTLPYPPSFRDRLRKVIGNRPDVTCHALETELTVKHADAAKAVVQESGLVWTDIDVIGFHGQTILHVPEQRETFQLGDGQLLADLTGVPVVTAFRVADVRAGGQGAPFVPLYHAALADNLARPLAVLNIGGVANVTWMGRGEDNIFACDTGPGNALLDDWVSRTSGRAYDVDGQLAQKGRIAKPLLASWLSHPFFSAPPPKSLDRETFANALCQLRALAPADGAATLTAFTAAAVASVVRFLPQAPLRWLVCGGGRHNSTLMKMLRRRLNSTVVPVEDVGWRGDSLEAEAFAFLAVRSMFGMPLSLPSTTGVPHPQTGGILHYPRQ